jgi:hypothetical protein
LVAAVIVIGFPGPLSIVDPAKATEPDMAGKLDHPAADPAPPVLMVAPFHVRATPSGDVRLPYGANPALEIPTEAARVMAVLIISSPPVVETDPADTVPAVVTEPPDRFPVAAIVVPEVIAPVAERVAVLIPFRVIGPAPVVLSPEQMMDEAPASRPPVSVIAPPAISPGIVTVDATPPMVASPVVFNAAPEIVAEPMMLDA